VNSKYEKRSIEEGDGYERKEEGGWRVFKFQSKKRKVMKGGRKIKMKEFEGMKR
jgi:hypothetical protein